jgi:hypothetical protein
MHALTKLRIEITLGRNPHIANHRAVDCAHFVSRELSGRRVMCAFVIINAWLTFAPHIDFKASKTAITTLDIRL